LKKMLAGKIVAVVGVESSGAGWRNGKTTALTFAREGARVVCIDASQAAADETARIIRDEGFEAYSLHCKTTKRDNIESAFSTAVQLFGRLDVLHNNVCWDVVGADHEPSQAEQDRAFAVNLKAAFNVMKTALPIMERQGGGSIINSMTSAQNDFAYDGYCANRAALNHMTSVAAAEYASKNIRINAILPAPASTPAVTSTRRTQPAYKGKTIDKMWNKRGQQMGTPWDMARTALFLASDEAWDVTGLALIVDCGGNLK
jgi:NAD(P)-dependent dehydrogenase (short-subunit alcohol dehydrogenase family)